MENLKHEKTAELLLQEFKDSLAYYFKNKSEWSKDGANALESLLLKIGYTDGEIYQIILDVKNEVTKTLL